MKKYYGYHLIDPNTNEVRYIGITCRPNKRFKEHIYSAKRKKSHKDKWILKLLENNRLPIQKIVYESFSKDDVLKFEKESILKYENLTNSTDGGDYFTFTPDVIEKMKKLNKGKNNPNYGKFWNDAQRKNHSKIMSSRKLNDEWKRNISINMPYRNEVTIKGIKYNSVSEARRITKMGYTTIMKLLKNNNNL